MVAERKSRFDALCQVGDAMGVRWKKDGDFLVARSTSFFWDKLKEVPSRYLLAWQRDSLARSGLPLEDLLAMSQLSDQQLASSIVARGIEHCWGLPEWSILSGSGAGPERYRANARFLAGLSPIQLRRALAPAGLPMRELAPGQLPPPDPKWGLFPEQLVDSRLNVDYVPAGHYVWTPWVDEKRTAEAFGRPVFGEKTRAAALAMARRTDPRATDMQIQPTAGVLVLRLTQPNGDVRVFGNHPNVFIGNPPGGAPRSEPGSGR